VHSLKHSWKPELIPNVGCAEEKQEAAEREKELEILRWEKTADEEREPFNRRAIFGNRCRFHHDKG